jgi:hypothetical protein
MNKLVRRQQSLVVLTRTCQQTANKLQSPESSEERICQYTNWPSAFVSLLFVQGFDESPTNALFGSCDLDAYVSD